MEWVDFWYDVMVGHEKILDNDQLVNSNCTNKRKLFIATDEPNSVVEEANRKWGNKYEIYRGKQDLQCEQQIFAGNCFCAATEGRSGMVFATRWPCFAAVVLASIVEIVEKWRPSFRSMIILFDQIFV
uniref:Uncharacterized protein n=1 Tax=Meloidogyne incognita TaxID=6306 RepID=A0A914KLZ7_MELIC